MAKPKISTSSPVKAAKAKPAIPADTSSADTPAAVTKPAPTQSVADTTNVTARLAALEARVLELENNNFTKQAEKTYKSLATRLRDQYNTNPTGTILVGLGVLLLLVILF